MNPTARRILLVGIALIVIVLVCFMAVLAWYSLYPRSGVNPFNMRSLFGSYDSNGEQIYFTGTSQSGPPITFQMGGMHRMGPRSLACADCHGSDGRGGQVTMMMTRSQAPDIRYHTLTEEEHDGDHAEHPAYTEETIRLAITQGLDPSGEPLDWVMPRWDMTDEQFQDLLEYLKTLD